MNEEFELTLEQMAGYVEEIGDEVIEKNAEDVIEANLQGEDYSLYGHHCQTKHDRMYLVLGHPEWRFMSTMYYHSLLRHTGHLVDEDDAKQLANLENDSEEEITSSDEMRDLAGRYLLDTLDQGEQDALQNYVYMFVSGGTNKTNVFTEDGVFEHFSVENSFFPFEDSFTIKDFYDAVQSTVTAGDRGWRLLHRTLFVDNEPDEPEDYTLDLHFNW